MAVNGAITYFYSLEQVTPIGGSILFNATSNNSITFPASSDLAVGTNDFTVEFFLYQTNNGSENFICSLGTNSNFGVSLGAGSNRLNVYLNTNKIANNISITGTTNDWKYYAVSRKSNSVYFYENGRLITSIANTTNVTDSTSKFYIGCQNPTDNTGDNFPGYITNFRFINGTGLYDTASITVPKKPLKNITNTKLLLSAISSNNFYNDFSIYNKLATNSGSTFSITTPF